MSFTREAEPPSLLLRDVSNSERLRDLEDATLFDHTMCEDEIIFSNVRKCINLHMDENIA